MNELPAVSLIEQQGLTLKVLEMYASERPLSEIQRHLKENGVELTGPSVLSFIDTKMQQPSYAEAVAIARRQFREKLRTELIKTAQQSLDESTRLLRESLENLNGMTLTMDNAKAVEAVNKVLSVWWDRLMKLTQSPEFKTGPSTAVQVNTFNSNDQSLRLMRLLQDCSRWLPPDKQQWLLTELDRLDGTKQQAPPAGGSVIDARFSASADQSP